MLWNGFEQIEFTFEEHLAYVIIPNKKIENPSLLIKTEYFNAFPETEIALLEEGYYLGFIKNDNRSRLVVEQSYSVANHCHAILISTLNNKVISYRTARLYDIFYAAFLGTFNIITEWEECIRTKSNAIDCVKVRTLFFSCEWLRSFCEVVLPDTFCTNIFFSLVDITINNSAKKNLK